MTEQPAEPALTPTLAYYQPPPPAARPRRVGLLVGLALATVLLLCAGGGVSAYFLVQDAQPKGSANPAAAVDGFLRAVFTERNADRAGAFVCARSRDADDLNKLVDTVRELEDKYESPRTTWKTEPVRTDNRQASADVTLTLTTGDERVATRQITLLLVDERGWWVCDVRAGS